MPLNRQKIVFTLSDDMCLHTIATEDILQFR